MVNSKLILINTIILLFIGLLFLPSVIAERQSQIPEIRIGVLALTGKEEAYQRWSLHEQYLKIMIPDYDFKIIPLSYDELKPAVEKQEVDFVITNPSYYIDLEFSYGTTAMATLATVDYGIVTNVYGGVIITQSDREDINTIQDLKGKSFMAVHEFSLGGYQAALREFKEVGINPKKHFSALNFAGSHKLVVKEVIQGAYDAGTVRTGILEEMVREGAIKENSFKVINPKFKAGFPYHLSTRLYPEWVFARCTHTPLDVGKNIALVLLQMPYYSPAAESANIFGWTVALDYQSVHDLMKELNLGPYVDYGKFNLLDVVQKYKPYFIMGLILFLVMLWTTAYMVETSRKIRETNLALIEVNKLLEEKNRELDAFSYSVSHDLKAPLRFIGGYAKTLVEEYSDKLDPEGLRILNEVVSNSKKMSNLVNDLLNFSKVSKERIEKKSVDMNKIVESIIEEFKLQEPDRLVQVSIGSLPSVKADDKMIHQVWYNLVSNAWKYTKAKEQGCIEIGSYTDNQEFIYFIRDNGIGFEMSEAKKLFSLFQKLHQEDEYEGTGAGLAIVERIVSKHGGRVWAEGELGKGATFFFSLPKMK